MSSGERKRMSPNLAPSGAGGCGRRSGVTKAAVAEESGKAHDTG